MDPRRSERGREDTPEVWEDPLKVREAPSEVRVGSGGPLEVLEGSENPPEVREVSGGPL